MDEYLKLAEVAHRLDVSEKTARRYVKSGAIPSVFIGNAYRVSEADLEKFLESARVEPGKAKAPTSSPESEAGEGRRVIDIPREDFRRALSEASDAGDEALIQLYSRLDAERINAELLFRADEDNHAARSDYARAVERRMRLFLTLVRRGVTLPDPEQLSQQVEQLEELSLLGG